VRADQSSGDFRLRSIERAGNHVLTVDQTTIGYPDKILARDISFVLRRSECLGIIGPNGSGKTTFLKTILKQIPPLAGEIRWGTKVEVGYYAQQLDDLDDRNEIIMELRRVASPGATAGELRSFLAKFLFRGDDVYKHVRDLSGGEKGRLALAKLIYSRVNVLVLDEPTNHLDIPSREALEEALDAYQGTILTISHDRYFLDRIATQILALDGVDMVCVGPNDLSVALTGRLDIHAKEVEEAVTLVLRKCREMSVMGLIFANDVDYAKPLVAAGWNVVAVGTDAGWFAKAAADVKREATESGS